MFSNSTIAQELILFPLKENLDRLKGPGQRSIIQGDVTALFPFHSTCSSPRTLHVS